MTARGCKMVWFLILLLCHSAQCDNVSIFDDVMRMAHLEPHSCAISRICALWPSSSLLRPTMHARRYFDFLLHRLRSKVNQTPNHQSRRGEHLLTVAGNKFIVSNQSQMHRHPALSRTVLTSSISFIDNLSTHIPLRVDIPA